MKSLTSKIALGSAQFGLDYGISNQHGKAPSTAVTEILDLAAINGIHLIDTASMYGNSEEVLGERASTQFEFITKIPALDYLRKQSPASTDNLVEQSLYASLKKLKREQCYGVLLHNADDLLSTEGNRIFGSLQKLKSEGFVKKIGVSCYSPDQIESILKSYNIDLIQFPFNVLDQRFLKNNFLHKLKDKGIELHARSVFLQGLLLMEPEQLNPYFKPLLPIISSLRNYSLNKYTSIRTALIHMAFSVTEIDHFLFGVVQKEQLVDIIEDVKNFASVEASEWSKFACSDPEMVNPHLWKLL